ncbi:MAG: paraslipin [Leptospiraceae bacterium]|nr:MAG: paraslipin [Leptospiraceae bacterium]
MALISLIVLFLVIFIIWKTFIIVPHQSAYIIERLGQYNKTLLSGFHFLIPIFDRVAYRHTLKEEAIDVPPQICITKDNVQVEVDGIIYIKVLDPVKASYNIQDYRFSSIQLAQTNMRSEIGKLDLDHTFKERETINQNVVSSLDTATEPWGVKVTRYEIKNIFPPKEVLLTMEKQMTAERDKRAEIIYAEGEKIAMINQSEGKKIEAINVSEGEKQKRINLAEGRAKKIQLLSEATAKAIEMIGEAINQPGGQEAMRLKIVEEYLSGFGDVLQKSTTKIVPLGPAIIESFFTGISKVSEVLKTKQNIPKPPHKTN